MQLLDLELCAAMLLDHDGTILRVGVGFERILAWDGRELVGKAWPDLCEPEHRQRFARAFDNLRSGAPSATVRARFPRYPEEIVLVSRLAAQDEGFLVVCEDVSTRNAAFESGSSMEQLIDFAADAWFVHDLEGNIRDVNTWACRNLGYAREELLQLKVADFEMTIQPGRMDGVWNRMEIGVPISVEGRQQRKDGSSFPVDIRLGLFESGDEVLMLAIARDITKRKRVEEELHRLNQNLESKVAERTEAMARTLAQRQAMLDNLGDGVLAVDANGHIELANPRVRELLGTTCAEGALLRAEVPPNVAEVIGTAQQGEPAGMEVSLSGDRIAHVAASPIRFGDAVTGVVARIRDITFEREIDRMKTDFIATVSHELRTPLTSVLGFTSITKNQLEKKIFPHLDLSQPGISRAVGRVRSNIEIIRSEGERLTDLINDVLDISKMEAGRMEWNFGPIEPRALVNQATNAVSALFVENPSLTIHIDEGLPAIRGDQNRLLQVLINLLSNAAKFADATVEVEVHATENGVEFSVSDDGCGIEPDLQHAIFEKFKQVGETLTNRPKGTGLGLPICAQIAEAHDTEIQVQSKVNEGSRFSIQLRSVGGAPLVTSRLDDLVARLGERTTEAGEGVGDILVVDDDSNIRELLRQELSERGYTIRQAANGFEAIGQVRAKRPDLIILDVMMPELSGLDVASMLKGDPTTGTIPILILSILEDAELGLRIGVDRYMTKPTDTQELLIAVRELIDPSSLTRQVVIGHDQPDDIQGPSALAENLEERGYSVVARCHVSDVIETSREFVPDIIVLETAFDAPNNLIQSIRTEPSLTDAFIVQLLPESS